MTPYLAAPDSSAPTRQGIKSASAPAEKSGERARRRSGRSAPSTPYLRSVGRSDRPSSIVAPNRKSRKRNRRRRRDHHRAATRRCTTQAAGAGQSAGRDAPRRNRGHHPPRDKEHHLASRKCRRESTPAVPPVSYT